MPLLEIENLHVEIDGKKILKAVDLAVNAGEVHAIMGPNGSAEVDILAQALLKAQEFFT
jgi:Fe-S cluster assembly ATP-binding protein